MNTFTTACMPHPTNASSTNLLLEKTTAKDKDLFKLLDIIKTSRHTKHRDALAPGKE